MIIDFKFEPLIFDVFFVNTKTSSLKFENISQKKWGMAIWKFIEYSAAIEEKWILICGKFIFWYKKLYYPNKNRQEI